MPPFLTPTTLTDLSRLPEIYRLRVAAWENSPGYPYVNARLFPNGFAEAHDTHPGARHWILEDEGGHIVAAARAVVLNSLDETGQPGFAALPIPGARPFGLLARLIIAPAYRKRGLARLFDAERMHWLRAAGVPFALAAPVPPRLPDLLAQGWALIGYCFCNMGGGD